MKILYFAYLRTLMGTLKISSDEEHILEITHVKEEGQSSEYIPQILKDAITQLNEYFAGKRKEFDLKIDLKGTEFQKNVWNELTNIKYGETKSYKDVATKIGNEKAVRAVGMTNSKNPISIVVPCHRVIGSNKKLTGYAGGLDRKAWLLNHEKENK
ncbi:methylated-DNA--[protein]-cysteine S-methyltransferase [Tepidibacter hydrothermalis]|uniref:Methylated-DNA--protein-cysteine methyltransferase n=1 Tax=Tepidibacter hydrothermalis TaxID=3036126 RepID=A0ABY8EDX1_9FIRM|nr:methylated-DNA--[protein]-cysteine S-methyltransferase [Tepidibacter hydrothermalis]WFD08938.1 methylated-DNA--[protein]-cysteine S-methyltransferase [Tepidibacter hydrothermalis]